MKVLLSLVLILTVVSVASAVTTVTLVPIEEGRPGSATNPLSPSDEIVVWVTSDGRLIGLDCILTVDGPGTIVGASSPDDCAIEPWYCMWDPRYSFHPAGVPGKSVEIGLGGGESGPSFPGEVAYFVIRCDDVGDVTATLLPGYGFGGTIDHNFEVPTISGSMTIHQIPEPTCWDATECAGQPSGDASCDGNIGLADLFALKAAFGRSAPWVDPECCSDYNHDNSVNLADLFILKGNYGTTGLSPSTGNQNCP
jgi:hypothetical protein